MMLHTPAPCLPEQTATTHLIVLKIRVTFTLCNLVQSLKHNRSCYEVAWHVFKNNQVYKRWYIFYIEITDSGLLTKTRC